MARQDWQYLPTATLEKQKRDEDAAAWAAQQRKVTAQQWADAHLADFQQNLPDLTMPPGPFHDPHLEGLSGGPDDPGTGMQPAPQAQERPPAPESAPFDLSAKTAGRIEDQAPQVQAGEPSNDSPFPTSLGDAFKRGMDQGTGQAPDIPPLPTMPTGPFRPLPGMPNKPTQPPEDTSEKITSGQPLDAQDFVSSLTKASMNQGTSPAFAEGMPGIKVGTSEEEAAARALGGAEKALGAEGPEATARGAYSGGAAVVGEAVTALPSLGETKRTGFSQAWKRARDVIGSQGQAGAELAQKLKDWRDTSERMAGEWYHRMPTVRSLDKSEFDNFVDVAEGKATAVSPKVQKAADEWRAVSDEVYQRGQAAGVEVAGKITDYFPHTFEPGTFTGKGWSDAVKNLVDTGQAKDDVEAAQILRRMTDTRRNRRYSNLEMEREANLPGYRRTRDVIPLHLQNAANRIAQVETFGNGDAEALKLLNRIGDEGYDAATAQRLFDRSVGAAKDDDFARAVSQGVRTFVTTSKLGLSALTNVGQNVNTATVGGIGRTLANVPKALSQDGREYALKLGVTLDGVIKDVRENTGTAGGLVGKFTAPGFNAVEKFNRTLAVHTGLAYADEMAAKAAAGDRAAAGALSKLGLNPRDVIANGGQLTEDDLATAARSFVERTQFKVDPQDLPGWASTPLGKLFFQFRSFSYNQTAFLKREIIDPLLQGDPKPLMRFAAAGLLVGGGITEAKNAVQNRPSEQDTAKRIVQYYNAVGGAGIAQDLVKGIIPIGGKNLPVDRQVTLAISTLLGPAVGTAAEHYAGVVQATRGDVKPLGRALLRDLPIVGPTAQNTLLPYQAANTPQAAPSVPTRSGGTRSGGRR